MCFYARIWYNPLVITSFRGTTAAEWIAFNCQHKIQINSQVGNTRIYTETNKILKQKLKELFVNFKEIKQVLNYLAYYLATT